MAIDPQSRSLNESGFMNKIKAIAPQIFDQLNPDFFLYRFYEHLITFFIELEAKKKLQEIADQLYYRRYFSKGKANQKMDREEEIKLKLFFFYCQGKKIFNSKDLEEFFEEDLGLEFIIAYEFELQEQDPSYLCSPIDASYRMHFILLRNKLLKSQDDISFLIRNFCPIFNYYQQFDKIGRKRSDFIVINQH